MEPEEKLTEFSKQIAQLRETFLGYPQNQLFDYEFLNTLGLFNACINNLGDPFVSSTYRLNSKLIEQEVIKFFAGLYKDSDLWGYVTADGSEGNLFGLYLGRELHPRGILYYSEDSHYSVAKAGRILNMDSRIIRSLENGAIDAADFERQLVPDRPAVINANIGTTVKAAIDDVDALIAIFSRLGREDYYIHCDAALSGMVLPYIDGAPQIDFSKNIGSLSISGHKFIGCPIPCGVVITRHHLVDLIKSHVEYLGTTDNTLLGSRSGLSPIFLWYAINTVGHDGFKKQVQTCLDNARYLYDALRAMDYPVWRNEYATTVYFKKPSDDIIFKWQLAKQGDIAHVIAANHVNREKLDRFIDDLKVSLGSGLP